MEISHADFRRNTIFGTIIATLSVALLAALLWLMVTNTNSGSALSRGGIGDSGVGPGDTNGDGMGTSDSGRNSGAKGHAPSQTGRENATASAEEMSNTTDSELVNGSEAADRREVAASRAQSSTGPEVLRTPPKFSIGELAAATAGASGRAASGEESAGAGNGNSTKFFGVKATGRKFVFIVDKSGSMGSRSKSGRRFQLACEELLTSIRRLRSSQSFYVFFFTGQTHPMFDDRDQTQLLPATSSNKRKLKNWVDGLRSTGGNGGEAATIIAALKLKPDAIFFLSDGGFQINAADQVRDANQKSKVPVNTIGFQDRSRETVLQRMADESGGSYRFVP